MGLDYRAVLQRFIRRGIRAARDRRVRPLPFGRIVLARLPATYTAAAQRLVDPLAVVSRWPDTDWSECDPLLKEFAEALLSELHKRQLPFVISEAFRSAVDQDEAFRRGASKARGNESAHNFGLAVDIVHRERGWDISKKEWAIVGLIGKEVARKRHLSITWGGDWDFYDPAHWALSDWKLRRDIPLGVRRYRHSKKDASLRRVMK